MGSGAIVIIVEDMEASRRFYEGLLGEQVTADYGPNVIYTSGLSLCQAEHAGKISFVGQRDRKTGKDRENTVLYFESEDVEAAFARLESAGAAIVHGVREKPCGRRTFRLRDPDNYIVEIGEPMPAVIKELFARGHSPEKISERTSMPMEVVLQAIGYPRFC
jgi:catechol 2,3-dioxygenase-like lactoylglutathione lyase family enzyme